MSEFLMPSLGADMEEATMTEWLVKPGDKVKRGDVVAVVETTKGAIEIEVFEDGVVEAIRVPEGETVPVGSVLADIRGEGEAAAGAAPEAKAPETAPEKVRKPAKKSPSRPAGPSPLRASPAARRRAAELGVSLEQVQGSGPDGAVTLQDIESAGGGTPAPKKEEAAAAKVSQRFDKDAMRRTIAAAMARSKREIPHYYLATTVNMQASLEWLRQQNEGRRITERLLYLVLPLKAIALALRQIPELNGYYKDGEFRPSESVNVGVAVALRGGGLVAPALRDADRKSPDEIMADLNDLIERSRRGNLRAAELSDPTITVSNMGERGVDTLYGVITPPQVAIVGLGRITDQPFVEEGELVVRPTMRMTLSADHRVSDGHRGALFLNAVDSLLQKPEEL